MQPVNKFSSTKNIPPVHIAQPPLVSSQPVSPQVHHQSRPGGPRRPHQKTIDRIHMAVRLEMRNLGMQSQDIAKIIGISTTAYSILKNTQIYKSIKNQYLSGVLSSLDDGVSDTYNLGRKYLEAGVPIAMQNLLRMALDETNKRQQLKASMEILDRHGMHAKVSRIGMATPEQNASATNEDNEMAQALLASQVKIKDENSLIDRMAASIDDPPITMTQQ